MCLAVDGVVGIAEPHLRGDGHLGRPALSALPGDSRHQDAGHHRGGRRSTVRSGIYMHCYVCVF